MDEAAGTIVLARDRGQVRVLTLNRPATRNAIDLELRVVLAEAIEGAMADGAVKLMDTGGLRGRDRRLPRAPPAGLPGPVIF